MNSKEHRKDFNRRWNILLQPDSPPVAFQKFKQRILNKHSKHGDNVNEVENEFLIYQTGLLLRYINKTVSQTEQQLKKQEG